MERAESKWNSEIREVRSTKGRRGLYVKEPGGRASPRAKGSSQKVNPCGFHLVCVWGGLLPTGSSPSSGGSGVAGKPPSISPGGLFPQTNNLTQTNKTNPWPQDRGWRSGDRGNSGTSHSLRLEKPREMWDQPAAGPTLPPSSTAFYTSLLRSAHRFTIFSSCEPHRMA